MKQIILDILLGLAFLFMLAFIAACVVAPVWLVLYLWEKYDAPIPLIILVGIIVIVYAYQIGHDERKKY